MSHDEFTRLFKYMERRFDSLEAKVDQKADKALIESALDHILQKLDTHEIELAAIKYQLNRHEGWFEQLAKSIQTTLK